jgi:hypothetical protein
MCSKYGLCSAEMRLLLNEESRDVEMSERIWEAEADEAKALWEGGEAGVTKMRCRKVRERLKNAIQAGGSDIREGESEAEANLRGLKLAIDRASWPAGTVAGFPDDESDEALLEQAKGLLPQMEALAAGDAKATRDVEKP